MSTAKWITPVRDGELIKFLRQLRKKFGDVRVNANLGQLQVGDVSAENDTSKAITAANGFAVSYLTCQHGNIYFQYSNVHGQLTPFSKLEIQQSQNNQASGREIDFVLEVNRFFGPIASGNPPQDSELQSQRLIQIESFLSGAIERFENLQTSFAQKNQELREQHEATVEEIREQQKKELALHLEAIRRKEEELQSARKELDDRSNTHARRDIRKDIKAEITTALQDQNTSKNVENKRNLLRLAYLIILGILGLLTVYSVYSFNITILGPADLRIWIAGVKAAVSSLSFLAVALLYLKWENSWLSQQSRFELTLASTKVDIDRASWIAESLLEWNRESPNSPIPNELLQSFSRRLFDWDAKVEDHHTASDSLASAILGSAAKLQIGPSGANVEIDRKGIGKLSK